MYNLLHHLYLKGDGIDIQVYFTCISVQHTHNLLRAQDVLLFGLLCRLNLILAWFAAHFGKKSAPTLN